MAAYVTWIWIITSKKKIAQCLCRANRHNFLGMIHSNLINQSNRWINWKTMIDTKC